MSDETLVPGIEQTALAEDPPKDIVVEAAEQTAEEAAAEVEPTVSVGCQHFDYQQSSGKVTDNTENSWKRR